MKRMFIMPAILAAVLLTGCYNPGSTVVPEEAAASRVITVNSRESVRVVPDMAEIVIGVTSQDPDAKVCQEQNTEAVNALIETLKSMEIAETSIQTSNYQLSTQNDWNNNGEIIGYEMRAELTVRDIALERVGDILAAAVAAGANEISSVSYLSSQYDASYQEALQLAVEKARQKAQVLAEAGGCTLGAVAEITEYADDQAVRYQNSSASVMRGGMGAAADMMPGEISIEANISVAFEIR